MKARYHRIDGWRGYRIPGAAIAGASDTGNWSDSPCPSGEVKAEIQRFQRECLRPAGIQSRQRFGGSSNAFCGKRWVCVSEADWAKAARLALTWLEDNKFSTSYLHSADQQKVLEVAA
jgi:hypothetical protein